MFALNAFERKSLREVGLLETYPSADGATPRVKSST